MSEIVSFIASSHGCTILVVMAIVGFLYGILTRDGRGYLFNPLDGLLWALSYSLFAVGFFTILESHLGFLFVAAGVLVGLASSRIASIWKP